MRLNRREFISHSGLLAVALATSPRSAFADTPTVISSLPAVITTPGRYILQSNLTYTAGGGAAIDIRTDNVSLDLGGYTLSNSGAGLDTYAAAVYADNRAGLTITNGTIDNFYTGVLIRSTANASARHIVSNLSVDNFTGAGLVLAGDGLVVRNNTLTSFVRAPDFRVPTCASGLMGIGLLKTSRCILLDNSIVLGDSGSTDLTFGLFGSSACQDLVILGTTVNGTDVGVAIDFGGGGRGEVRDSSMSNVRRKHAGLLD